MQLEVWPNPPLSPKALQVLVGGMDENLDDEGNLDMQHEINNENSQT